MAFPDLTWLALGTTCAISLATADAVTKRFFADCSGQQLLFVRFVFPGLLLIPLGVLYPLPSVPWPFWYVLIGMVPLELLAMWLYMMAIRDFPLQRTLPYLAFTPVFNVFTGFAILGERVSWPGFAGIVLVVSGAYFLNIDQASRKAWLAPLTGICRNRGSGYMLAVAAIYSVTSVLGKRAMLYATPISFGPFYFIMLGTIIAFGLICSRQRQSILSLTAARWRQLFLVALCVAVMIVTHFLAIAKVPVAYFISLKRTSLLFGIVYGFALFREPNLLRHLFAGTLMVSGVALIVVIG